MKTLQNLENYLKDIECVDMTRDGEIQSRLDNLTKPQGSLGRLEEMAKRYALITGRSNASIKNKIIFTLAADHGVAEEGVSAFPKEVTAQMVYNFLRGGAGVNVLAKHVGARVIVVDMGVDHDFERHEGLEIKKIGRGTKNMTLGPAMTREDAERAVIAGIELVQKYRHEIDIIGTGDMGIGNTTPSAAIVSVITGTDPELVTGRGTGINDVAFNKKLSAIKKAISINKPDPKDALDVLSKVGGFEIAGIAGVILGGAMYKIPVVIDGFISTAGALIAAGLSSHAKDYLIAAHKSVEVGHLKMLEYLGLEPLLDLNMRLGEGTGAALGISLVEAGVNILSEMATFSDAGVDEKSEK